MSEIRFTLRGVPPSLANMRGHWQKARAVKEWREYAWYGAAAARVLASSPSMRIVPSKTAHPVRRRLTIVLYRQRLLDHDNAVASLKGVIDGCIGQLVVDDDPGWMALTVLQSKVDKRSQQRVEIVCANWDGISQGGIE